MPSRNPSTRPTLRPTFGPTPPPKSPTRVPTRAPTSPPTLAPVSLAFTQVISGMTIDVWATAQGPNVYQAAVFDVVNPSPMNVLLNNIQVSASTGSRRLRSLQNTDDGGAGKSLLITTVITCSPSARSAVLNALQTPNAAGVDPITFNLRATGGPAWGNVQTQSIVTANSPTMNPTFQPTKQNGANSAGTASTQSVGGLPKTTIIAVVVVLVLVLLAGLYVAYRQNSSSKSVVHIQDYYGAKEQFNNVSPLARRPSNGQRHVAPRPSLNVYNNQDVEMTDTYGVSSDYDMNRRSRGDNPAFGSSRLSVERRSSGRMSLGGGDGGRRSSFDGMAARPYNSGAIPPPHGAPLGVVPRL